MAYMRYCQNLDAMQYLALYKHVNPHPVNQFTRRHATQYRSNFPDTPFGRAYCNMLCSIGPLAWANVTYSGPIQWEQWMNHSIWIDMYTDWRTKLPETLDIIVFALAFASHCMTRHYGSFEFQLLIHHLITSHTPIPLDSDALWKLRTQHQELRVLYKLWAVDKLPLFITNHALVYHNPFNNVK